MEREIETKCLHLEEDEGKTDHFGAISYPIYQTATYAHPGVGQSTGYDYSQFAESNQRTFRENGGFFGRRN